MDGSHSGRHRESGPSRTERGRGLGIQSPLLCPVSPASASWVNRSQGHGIHLEVSLWAQSQAGKGRAGVWKGRWRIIPRHRKDGTEREEQNRGEMGLVRDTKFKGRDRNANVLGQGEGGDSAKEGPSAGVVPCCLALLSL